MRAPVRIATAVARRLPVVIYHRVLAETDSMLPGVPDRASFARQLDWLTNAFDVRPLHEAQRALFDGTLRPGTLCITFDDGYRDNFEHALPVLCDYGVTATFFVTTAHMGGGLMWNDRIIEAVRASAGHDDVLDLTEFDLGRYSLEPPYHAAADAVLADLKYREFGERDSVSRAILKRHGPGDVRRVMMRPEEIRGLHDAGMEIGGHTHEHPILARLDRKAALEEITSNKFELESIIGTTLKGFAYPNGRPGLDYTVEHAEMLRAVGYEYAVSTSHGAAARSCDRFQIPRFSPWDETELRYNLRLLRNYFMDPVIAA